MRILGVDDILWSYLIIVSAGRQHVVAMGIPLEAADLLKVVTHSANGRLRESPVVNGD